MRSAVCGTVGFVLWLSVAASGQAQPIEQTPVDPEGAPAAGAQPEVERSIQVQTGTDDGMAQLAESCRESPAELDCLRLYRPCVARDAYVRSNGLCEAAGFPAETPDALWLERVANAVTARCAEDPELCDAYAGLCARRGRTPTGAMLCSRLGFEQAMIESPFANARFRPEGWLQVRQSPFGDVDFGVGIGASVGLWLDESAITLFGLVERHELGGDANGFAAGGKVYARFEASGGGTGNLEMGIGAFYSQHGSEEGTRHRNAASWVALHYYIHPLVRLEAEIAMNYLQPLDWLGVIGGGEVEYYSPVSAGLTAHLGPVYVGGAITQYLGGDANANFSGYAALIF